MGMFDEIEVAVPVMGLPAGSYQSKNFDCQLEMYDLTPEGRLLRHRWEWEIVPENERTPPGPGGLPLLRPIPGSERITDIQWHGMVNAYGDGGDFVLKFTDGVLVSVTPVQEPTP